MSNFTVFIILTEKEKVKNTKISSSSTATERHSKIQKKNISAAVAKQKKAAATARKKAAIKLKKAVLAERKKNTA